ncbi:regucalcin-like [Belonocnema kinseyi]|uniref:regucalcin-like n=1 Tax=Belonocnema kinseyi TaxID=2817044 RepID=UPI00143CE66D|nr:regucalcin-like [Belonocnema kinseyi]
MKPDAGPLSFAVLVRGKRNKYVVGAGKEILLVTWDSSQDDYNPECVKIAIVDNNIPDNRLSYGTVDPLDRLVFGTMNENGHPFGNVTSCNHNFKFVRQIKDIITSSGFVWEETASGPSKVYFVDALSHYDILAYSFHKTAGTFRNHILALDWSKISRRGTPRRLTIDRTGKLWVPLYEGRGIMQVDPAKHKIVQYIPVPAKRVGACVFGGPNLDVLYVSTIGYGHKNDPESRPFGDQGGTIFAFRGLGAKGWAPEQYRMEKIPDSVQLI